MCDPYLHVSLYDHRYHHLSPTATMASHLLPPWPLTYCHWLRPACPALPCAVLCRCREAAAYARAQAAHLNQRAAEKRAQLSDLADKWQSAQAEARLLADLQHTAGLTQLQEQAKRQVRGGHGCMAGP